MTPPAPPPPWEAPTCRGRGVSLCFLPRGLSRTWGPMSSGRGFFGGWLTIISFHLEKSFGVIKDNCAHVKARRGDGSRLSYLINNMCILRFGLPRSGSLVFHRQTHPPPTAVDGGTAHGCPCLSSSCPRRSGAAAVHATTVSSGTSSGKSSSETCGTRGRPHIRF